MLAEAKIRLLTSPSDEDQKQLSEVIEAAMGRLRSEEAPDDETEADIRAIVVLAQSILRREWLRVKLGT